MPDIQNAFLRALTAEQLAALEPLQPVELKPGEYIYEQGDPVSHLIFIDTGFVSTRRRTPDGIDTEIWSWGGPTALLGAHTILQDIESLFSLVVRIAGAGWAVPRERIHSLAAADPAFALYLQRIVKMMSADLAQMLACHIAHPPAQRFARILLMLAEATGSLRVPLRRGTTLNDMMGISRRHLYVLATQLRGVVRFETEFFLIENWLELERRACPCLREAYNRRRTCAETAGGC